MSENSGFEPAAPQEPSDWSDIDAFLDGPQDSAAEVAARPTEQAPLAPPPPPAPVQQAAPVAAPGPAEVGSPGPTFAPPAQDVQAVQPTQTFAAPSSETTAEPAIQTPPHTSAMPPIGTGPLESQLTMAPALEPTPAKPLVPGGPTGMPNLDIPPPDMTSPVGDSADVAPSGPSFAAPPSPDSAAAPGGVATAVAAPPPPDPSSLGGSDDVLVPPPPSGRSAASKFDIAANMMLVAFLISVAASLALTLLGNGMFSEGIGFGFNLEGTTGLASILIPFAAGMVAVFDPPGKAWVRNLYIAAVVMLILPLLRLWRTSMDDRFDGEEAMEAVIRSFYGPHTVLAIAAILTLRHRKLTHGAPHIAAAALVVVNFFAPLSDSAAIDEQFSQGVKSSVAFSLFGSLALLLAITLVVVDGRSAAMLRFLRNAGIAGAVGVALAYPLARWGLTKEDYIGPRWIISSLPASIMVIGLVISIAFMATPKQTLHPNDKPIIGMGPVVLSAILFWPVGLVAVSHAGKSIAAAENSDQAGSREFARKAKLWRNTAYGLIAAMFVLLLIGSAQA